MSDHPLARRTRRISPARAITMLAVLVTAVVLIAFLYRRAQPQYSTAEMLRSIHATALHHSQKPGVPDGGPLGPWWIAATDGDPITGELRNFSITSDSMIIAARIARVEIDPVADTVLFDMDHVVMTRFEAGSDAETHELHEMEHYRLGPAPIGADIRPDAGGSALPPPRDPDEPSSLAGIEPPAR